MVQSRVRRAVAIGLVALVVFAWGCGEDEECQGLNCGDLPRSSYLPQTSPENVLHNLEVAFERREIEEYAKLLDPEFIFKFQEADIPPGLEREYWNRDEDSTGVGALFNCPEIASIRVDLGEFTVEDAGRLDEPGAMRIRLTQARLEVDTVGGRTLLVEDNIQDFYLRRGSTAWGTDPEEWYIFEWQDQVVGAGSTWRDLSAGGAAADPLVILGTWGRIKSLCR